MLIVYDLDDLRPSHGPISWHDRLGLRVLSLTYVRSNAFDKSKMQNWVRKIDGEPLNEGKNWVYNHYVPHSRIRDSIRDTILGNEMTRTELLEWLIYITGELKIVPDIDLQQSRAEESRAAYDTWVDWAITAICDWKCNIFFGPGEGDHGGTSLDTPTGTKQGKQQLERVQEAQKRLEMVLGDDRISQKVTTEAYFLADREPDRSIQHSDDEARALLASIWGDDLPDEDAGDADWSGDDEMKDDKISTYGKTLLKGPQLQKKIEQDPNIYSGKKMLRNSTNKH